MKKNLNLLFTPGRAGSTFLANLLLQNRGVEFLEWFSPESYSAAYNAGNATSKPEYLRYVYEVVRGLHPLYGVKITPDICATAYWELNILSDLFFQDSLAANSRAVILTRLNPWDTLRSMLYAEITGVWHSYSTDQFSALDSSNEIEILSKDISLRFSQSIDNEIKLFEAAVNFVGRVDTIFYEELYYSREHFARTVLRLYDSTDLAPKNIVFPGNRVGDKDPTINAMIDTLIDDIERSPHITDLISIRGDRFKELGIFSRHHSINV